MASVDDANIKFWNELCGTNLATVLGITDSSPESLKKFDDWFFEFYPYLLEYVSLTELTGRDVLEVGLGYGSLSQKIAESGARYVGLDIALGPVEMVCHRLRQAALAGDAKQGSIVEAPFSDNSFDYIVAIGCLHHTGDMRKGIDECRRLLRAGGSLIAMVYYAYSYRRWVQAPSQTLGYLVSEILGYRGVLVPRTTQEKWYYDHNSMGMAAPHTDFVSVKSLRNYCRLFSDFHWQRRNIDQEPSFRTRTRPELLASRWPGFCGLEIYMRAIK